MGDGRDFRRRALHFADRKTYDIVYLVLLFLIFVCTSESGPVIISHLLNAKHHLGSHGDSKLIVCNATNDCWRHLSNTLEAVVFVDHNIGVLDDHTLFGEYMLVGVTSLDLTDNNVTEIVGGAFRSTPNLIDLTLARNSWTVTSSADDVFYGLRQLRHIDLRSTFVDNDVTSLELLLGNSSNTLGGLETLRLQDNGLERFDVERALSSLNELRELWLSGNRLETLEFRESAMKSVRVVHVNSNEITWFSRESVANMILMNTSQSLEVVNVSNNPFECTCRNRWFILWVSRALEAVTGSSRVLADVEQLTCRSPPRLANRTISSLKLVDIDSQLCRSREAPYTVYHIVAGLLIALLVFVCIVKVLMRDRKMMRQKTKRGDKISRTLPSSNWHFV